MAEKLIIGISGVRGIVGENLTGDIAAQYGSAFGTFLKNTTTSKKEKMSVCIGRDSRSSGEMLKTAVAEGLTAVGIDMIDLGIVSTPGVGVMVTKLGCDGGVIITASHNPIQYNGIKLLLNNGLAPSPEEVGQIKRYYHNKDFSRVEKSDEGTMRSNDQTDAVHLAKVLGIVEKETIRAKKFKVVLDSVNGAGGRLGKKLLTELGCEIAAINYEPTGLFTHEPEPREENLGGLCEEVKNRQYDIGFAQDPDADRLAIVDEGGRYLGEEYSLALVAKCVFSKKTGSAATNLSTSRMIDDVAAAAGSEVFRSPVGEVNVAIAMLEHNCVIGGEGNGGVIDLRVGPIRNSFVGMALVLQLMAETGKSVGELADEIGGYYMNKTKFSVDKSQVEQMLDSVKKLFAGAKLDTTDGCRFDFDDGWLHLRPSNTEPIMRLVVEAKDPPTAQKYIDMVLKMRNDILG